MPSNPKYDVSFRVLEEFVCEAIPSRAHETATARLANRAEIDGVQLAEELVCDAGEGPGPKDNTTAGE